jgi:membrane protease YdiL (CAAX protease family)
MNTWRTSILAICLLSFFGATSLPAFAADGVVSPAAVGWGNLLVPGLGATIRGHPGRGLLESTLEIGTYYGGTFYSREGSFTIDGTVLVPSGKNVTKPLMGQVMQEFGLKLHMWNTFYNYQQASMHPGNADLELKYQQPLYNGKWDDVLLAPFKWKNLSSPWVYLPILASAGYLAYSYRTTDVVRQNHFSSPGEEALYGFVQGVSIPLGSSFGEEVLYRGFIQREMRYYTDSIPLSILTQTAIFVLNHPPDLRPASAFGGVYFGLMANHFDGDLEPGIASHFWIDFVSGVFVYLSYRKVEGKKVPFSAQLSIPF